MATQEQMLQFFNTFSDDSSDDDNDDVDDDKSSIEEFVPAPPKLKLKLRIRIGGSNKNTNSKKTNDISIANDTSSLIKKEKTTIKKQQHTKRSLPSAEKKITKIMDQEPKTLIPVIKLELNDEDEESSAAAESVSTKSEEATNPTSGSSQSGGDC